MRRVADRLAGARARLAAPGTSRARIVDSTVWTLGERVVTLGATWVVNILVANHLGVVDFGRLSYAIALVALFGSVISAGLSGLVVRDLVRAPDDRDGILGTVFAIRAVTATVSLAAVIGSTFLVTLGGADQRLLVAIVGFGLLFRSIDVVEFWFQSRTQLRYVSQVNLVATVVGAAARLLLVLLDGSLLAFAATIAVEQALTSGLFLATYLRNAGSVRRWRPSFARARTYLTRSWPLLLSGIATTLNRRVDMVLLGALLGASSVGVYAVAARLSEVWYFVPQAIVSAVFPSLIRAKDAGEAVYRRRLRQLYCMFVWAAIAVAILVTLVAETVIDLLYRPSFATAATVLVIHVWTAPWLFMNIILSKWLIIENLLMTSLVRHGTAATVNIGLNLLLVPRIGVTGAAYASLVSYATATYLACFLSRRTWPAAVDMTLGFLLPFQMALRALGWRRDAATVLDR